MTSFDFPSLLPVWVVSRVCTLERAAAADATWVLLGGISFVYKVKNLASLKKCKALCYEHASFNSSLSQQ